MWILRGPFVVTCPLRCFACVRCATSARAPPARLPVCLLGLVRSIDPFCPSVCVRGVANRWRRWRRRWRSRWCPRCVSAFVMNDGQRPRPLPNAECGPYGEAPLCVWGRTVHLDAIPCTAPGDLPVSECRVHVQPGRCGPCVGGVGCWVMACQLVSLCASPACAVLVDPTSFPVCDSTTCHSSDPEQTLVTALVPSAPLPLASCTCACGQCGLWIRRWLSTPAGECRPSGNPPLWRRKEGGGVLVVRSCHVLCFVRYAVSWRPLTSLSCTVCILLCPRCVGLRVSHALCCRTS